MSKFLAISAALFMICACGPTPGGSGNPTPGSSASPGASASPGSSTGVSGNIYASKQNYMNFLDCAGKKDATAAATAAQLKAGVNIFPESQWEQTKIIVQATHKSFIDRYGSGCM